jgi:uncharacterized protein (TIGR02453 family)
MKTVLSFLKALAKNNNREWFNDHKKQYNESLEIFRGLTEDLKNGITAFDPSLSATSSKDAIFRIYKDVRFSKDKSPYKTHFGCWLTKGGRKSTDAGYYFHLEPGGSFIGAGVWMPPKEQLHLIRQEIQFHPEQYLDIVNNPEISGNYERGGKEDMLKKGPAGFSKDFPHMELLKYKHHIFSKNYTDSEVVKPGLAHRLAGDFRPLYPLISWLNHAMSFTGNE